MNNHVQAVCSEHADSDVLVISHEITRALHGELSKELKKKKHDKCVLFLTTYGGDADGAYRIGRCLQHHFEYVRLVVPSSCKSAGTLIAIAANELVIGDLGELGPLDAQGRKAHELFERGSGLDSIQALQMCGEQLKVVFRDMLLEMKLSAQLSTSVAGDFAARVATSVADPLYSQIDVNRLGEMQRANQIAIDYGTRLSEKSNSLYAGALSKLTLSYPSHGFVIDRKEAKELFVLVSRPSEKEVAFIENYWHILGQQGEVTPLLLSELFAGGTPSSPGAQHEQTGTVAPTTGAEAEH